VTKVRIEFSLEETACDRPPTPQPSPHQQPEPGAPILAFTVGTPLADIEREAITRTLEHFDGDKQRAARALGIDVTTLYRKLKRYDCSEAT
jgi:DNA-binding NtrC family response regulator